MMVLGEQLKKYRNDRGLNQPELANLAGIEQSYLSKLENGKSLPSNDIFRQLLIALDMNLEQFLAPLQHSVINEYLKQIPDVEYWLTQQQNNKLRNQRKYLYVSSFLIVLAVTLFYIGYSAKLYSHVQYQYESPGIVLASEPNNIYGNWNRLLDRVQPDYNKRVMARRLEIEKRKDSKIYLSAQNVGSKFIVNVDGGRRLYRFDKEITVVQKINAWLQIIGVFFFISGIMGFILERKLFK